MLLRVARVEDLAAIVALERLDESRKFVGQWSDERHLATLTSQDARYVVAANEEGGLHGYAILRGFSEDSGSIELKRLVVHPPGHGLGRNILEQLIRLVFDAFHAHRLFLDVFDDNARAFHLYQDLGFVEEGVMREAALRDGTYFSLRLMSILRSEYLAQPKDSSLH